MSLTWKKALLFWTAHGIVCAAPSFAWAIMTGHNTPTAISAMLTGVAILIFIYTWLSTNTRISVDKRHGLLASSIRCAAHLRAIFAALTMVSFFENAFRLSGFVSLGKFFSAIAIVDILTGVLAKRLVGLIFPQHHPQLDRIGIDFVPEYFPTLLDTLVTGVLFSILFVFIVIAVRVTFWLLMKVRRNA